MERLLIHEHTFGQAAMVGRTALEELARPVEVYGRPQPPDSPPEPFETQGGATPFDMYGNPDVDPPDTEWLYE